MMMVKGQHDWWFMLQCCVPQQQLYKAAAQPFLTYINKGRVHSAQQNDTRLEYTLAERALHACRRHISSPCYPVTLLLYSPSGSIYLLRGRFNSWKVFWEKQLRQTCQRLEPGVGSVESWCLLTSSALRATSVDQIALGLRCASVTTGAFLREPERPSMKQALQGFVMS